MQSCIASDTRQRKLVLCSPNVRTRQAFAGLFPGIQIGTGCGIYGGPQGEWSHISKRSLVPGARARFWAYGIPNGFAIAAFGQASPVPIPLS